MRHYRVKIIAITNGPDQALLLERKSADPHNLHVTTYALPDLAELIERDALDLRAHSDSESLSASLPEATGDPAMSLSPDFRQFKISSSSTRQQAPQQPAYSGLLLNPLGAGDTCSGVFFVEYLDTRVCFSFYIYRILSLTYNVKGRPGLFRVWTRSSLRILSLY
jgi:hypothetical protein